MSGIPNPYDELNNIQDSNAIPFFDKNGTALSQTERESLAKRRGVCLRCGVKTHEQKFLKMKALSNEHVYHGICIRCNPETVPSHIHARYMQAFPPNDRRAGNASRDLGRRGASNMNRMGPSSRRNVADHSHRTLSDPSSRHLPESAHSHHRPTSDHAQRHRPVADSKLGPPTEAARVRLPSEPSRVFRAERSARNMQPPQAGLLVAPPTQEDYTGGKSEESTADIFEDLRDPRMKGDAVLVRRKLHRLRNLGPTLQRTSSQDEQNQAVYDIRDLMDTYVEDARVMTAACGAMWTLIAVSDDSMAVASETRVAQVVIESLRSSRNQTELYFMPWAFGLLTCLASFPGDMHAIASAKGIETITRIINVNAKSGVVLEWACRSMHSLVHAGEEDGEPEYNKKVLEVVRSNIASAIDAKIVSAVAKAMKNAIKEPTAETWAVKLLWRLLDQEDSAVTKKVLKKIKDEDGVVMCVDILKAPSTTPELFEMTVTLVCELIGIRNDSIATKSATEGIFTTVRMMKNDENDENESLQEACCGFLSTMAAVGKDCKKCIDEAHGIEAIVGAMVKFPANRGIMEAGSHLLWAFSVTVPVELQQCLPDAFQAFILGTNHHVDSAPLQAAACAFIANIAVAQITDASNLPSEIPIRALSLGLSDPSVCEEASRAIAYLSMQSPSSSMDTELIEDLVDAALNSNAVGQEGLCSALCAIAASSESNRKALVSAGCLEAATEILQESESESSAGRAMELISVLAVADSAKPSTVPPECVQAIVDAMKTKLESAESRKLSCKALRNLLLGSKPGVSLNFDALVDIVTEIIDKNSEVVSLKMEACGVLWALVAKHPRQSGVLLGKMFKSILGAMSLHRGEDEPYHSDLQVEGMGALFSVTTALRGHTCQLENSDVESIVAIMCMILEYDSERIGLQEQALDVILNLSHIDEGIVVQCGGIVVVIDAMVEHETAEGIQERGCSILALLSSTENLQVNLGIAELDGIEFLVNALAVFSENERIQMDACKALSHLSVDHESRMLISSQGGLLLVVNAMKMRRNRDNIQLVEAACAALLNLSSDVEEQAIADTSAVKTVVELMRYHPDAQTFQEKGLGVLQNVAMRNAAAKREIAQVGGIHAVTAAVKEFMGEPTVLERAFTTLWSLAVLEQNQIIIADVGGIGLVVNGMMANINYDKVQKQACGCLCTLSSNSRNKNIIRDAGGVDAIVFAMWAHYDSEVLQVEACRALSSLAVNVHTNEVMIATEGEISAIISAMRRFPDSWKLQEHACVAMRNFLLSADNALLIRKSTSELLTLMTLAANKYPDRCAERANQVLDSLTS